MADPVEPQEEFGPALLDAFREEARDLLAEMEAALMRLEERPDDPEPIAQAFRALHTIKGNAVMFGFETLEATAHELEHVFDLLRKGRMTITGEIIGLTLSAKDRLLALLGRGEDSGEEAARRAELHQRIGAILGTAAAVPDPPTAAAPSPTAGPGWRIRFRPDPGILAGGTDPLAILDGLRAMGPCRVTARFDEVPALEQLDPERCYLSWEIDLSSRHSLDEVRDAFVFVGGPGTSVEIVPAGRDGDACGAAEAVPPPPPPGVRSSSPGEASTLRVGAERLDALVDLVGELVTVQARLTRHAGLAADPALAGIAEEVERLTADLRDLTLGIRMVPVRPTFGKFRRLVRDLAREIGREVDFETAGEETELDKTVIERLSDPIVHLLRNCIDHGIEPPEERERAGKRRRGRVRLAAAHAGAQVVIRVEDDGRGIDLDAIRGTAVARGLIGEHEALPERELQALVFAPGFSTSARVTNVSGRGVGLDVVRRAIEDLRGSIRIESRDGAGTTFEVQLPLTLAIIEGLAVVLGDERFVIPLAVVRECVELAGRAERERRVLGMIDLRGEVLPYLRLREWFGVPGSPPAIEQVVVTEAGGLRVGIAVDFVDGEHQTVIKPLGRLFRDVRGLAGSTILGDGSVALILDVEQLVARVGDGREPGPAGRDEREAT